MFVGKWRCMKVGLSVVNCQPILRDLKDLKTSLSVSITHASQPFPQAENFTFLNKNILIKLNHRHHMHGRENCSPVSTC